MNNGLNLPATPTLAFFSEDFFVNVPSTQRSGELKDWMWQQALSTEGTGLLYICPKAPGHDLSSSTKLTEVMDVLMGEHKYFFTLELLTEGTGNFLLLNFDIDQNTAEIRAIDPHSIKHALIIGLCAARALKNLNIKPRSFLLSSLYSIGLQFERARFFMEEHNLTFEEAQNLVAHDCALFYYTHPTRSEQLSFLEVNALLKNYAAGFQINWARFLSLGSIGEQLEERCFSLRKLAASFVTLWPTLSALHEHHARRELSQVYEDLAPPDIPIVSLNASLPIHIDFAQKRELSVVFDMRGPNFELLKSIFEHPLWSERYQHRLFTFKTIFIKDKMRSIDDFQTNDGKAFAPDQIILNFEEIQNLASFASACSLYVRAQILPDTDDDLFSLYLMSQGSLLFMDDQGWWQRGFRFEFGRRWESEFELSDYFIQQFFDVLLQTFGSDDKYRKLLDELANYLELNYSPALMMEKLKNNAAAKLSSIHDHLHCFNLSNFHQLELKTRELTRYWNSMSALSLDIEGDYLMLEREALGENWRTYQGSFIDASEIEVQLKLYAPKIAAESLVCELMIFDQSGRIVNTKSFNLTEIEGKGSSQVLHFKLAKQNFHERTYCAIRITAQLGHFEFPFETKLAAWI